MNADKKRKDHVTDDSRPLTEGRFKYYFECIKEMVQSTKFALQADITGVQKDVAVIKKDVAVIKNDVKTLKVAVSQHSRMIKGLDAKIDGVRTELKEDMRQMERRLSDKIDGHTTRLDDHESRICALEVR